MGRERLGSRSPLFFPLFGAPKRNPSNNREGRCVLALGGRRCNDTHNNQMQDGFHITVDVGEGALPGRNMGGDVVSSVFWLWREIALKVRTPFDFLHAISTRNYYWVTAVILFLFL
jgi:hypothetical protein